MTNRDDDGFTLIEVLVGFAIAALGLVAAYTSIADSGRAARVVAARAAAASDMQSHLDRLLAGPLAAGESTGTYDSGMAWRLVVTPLGHRGATAAIPAHVLLTTPTARLETFAFIPRAP